MALKGTAKVGGREGEIDGWRENITSAQIKPLSKSV